MADNPKTFYSTQIEKNQSLLEKVKKQLFAFSMLRLLVFCLFIAGLYFAYSNTRLVVGIIVVTIVIFLLLVSRYTELQYKRDKLVSLIKINRTELDVLNRNFHHLPDGDSYKDPQHYFSQDIDLFGKGSFYQYANRTVLAEGSDTLAVLFTENTISNIEEKQRAIKELSNIPEWRQNFQAIASLSKSETDTRVIVKWLNNYNSFVPNMMRYLPLVFSGLSVVVGALYFMNFIPESFLIYWVLFGLLITGVYTKKITKLGYDTAKIQSTFEQYNKLLLLIEETEFTSELLNLKKELILTSGRKTSAVLREFSGLLSSLDQNNNFFFLVLGNGLFLRGLATCFKIENWIHAHGKSVENWFKVIAFFDAHNSLGNFAFNHPNYVFPDILEQGGTIKSVRAGHPLLSPDKAVLNDFEINTKEFFIITGANMAGKSTFLRTVSLQIVMANIGLPVCATSVSYAPIKLITSMRTTDSLTDDESYFFSELKRLKFIVDEIQKDNYFIVLDEILKGTNSTDKAKGSRKFVERLVSSKSTGIIATHDLSLCEVARTLSQVKNHYFDAEIINDELHFDYKFKEGICKNMNASFLLKKMEIVE